MSPKRAKSTSICSKHGGLLESCRCWGLGMLCVAEVQAVNFAFTVSVLLSDFYFIFLIIFIYIYFCHFSPYRTLRWKLMTW